MKNCLLVLRGRNTDKVATMTLTYDGNNPGNHEELAMNAAKAFNGFAKRKDHFFLVGFYELPDHVANFQKVFERESTVLYNQTYKRRSEK